eukprot:3248708-Prymnesium_polylepis.1
MSLPVAAVHRLDGRRQCSRHSFDANGGAPLGVGDGPSLIVCSRLSSGFQFDALAPVSRLLMCGPCACGAGVSNPAPGMFCLAALRQPDC